MKIGTKEITVKPLGAVQALNVILTGARQQYIDDAKSMASALEGREKAAFMAEMHRGLKNVGSEEAHAWSQTMQGLSALIAKATGLSREEAGEILDEADETELRMLMDQIQPGVEEDEQVVRFQRAVDAVLSARLDNNRELMESAVEECVNALRSVSVLEEETGKK